MNKKITIGTRGSKLAMLYAQKVKEKIIKSEKDIACTNQSIKTCIRNKSKTHAKILLRKKKILQNDINSISNQILSIQKRISTLESLELTKLQINSISEATKVFKTFTTKNNIERIEKLQDDMLDLTDQLCDIDQVFAVDDVDIDDAVLELEYEDLEKEVALELPDVPTHDIQEHSVMMPAV